MRAYTASKSAITWARISDLLQRLPKAKSSSVSSSRMRWATGPNARAFCSCRKSEEGNNEHCPCAKIHSGGDLPFRASARVARLGAAKQYRELRRHPGRWPGTGTGNTEEPPGSRPGQLHDRQSGPDRVR